MHCSLLGPYQNIVGLAMIYIDPVDNSTAYILSFQAGSWQSTTECAGCQCEGAAFVSLIWT